MEKAHSEKTIKRPWIGEIHLKNDSCLIGIGLEDKKSGHSYSIRLFCFSENNVMNCFFLCCSSCTQSSNNGDSFSFPWSTINNNLDCILQLKKMKGIELSLSKNLGCRSNENHR